jgi:hypothetical protein
MQTQPQEIINECNHSLRKKGMNVVTASGDKKLMQSQFFEIRNECSHSLRR